MNKKIMFLVMAISFIVIMGVAMALDFDPRGNILGRGIWSIVDFVNINMSGNLNMGTNNITDVLKVFYNITGCEDDTIGGTTCWNADDYTLNIVTGMGNVVLQVNQETVGIGINKEGRDLLDGTVVSAISFQGDRITFIAANSSNAENSSMIGVLTQDCANNNECFINFFGFVRNINTTAFSSGDRLYIDPTQPGNFTATPPTLPNNPVWVATAIVIHAQSGMIFVNPMIDASDGFLIEDIWATGNVTANWITATQNWTDNTNYPAACPSGTWITTVGDANTCTAPTAEDVDPGTFPSGNYTFQGNVTAENVFLPAFLFAHMNTTMLVASAGTWYNVTFEEEVSDPKLRVMHTHDDTTNDTFTIQDTGFYNIHYAMSFSDASPSPTSHIAMRVINNGAEIPGSLLEEDSTKQYADFTISNGPIVYLTSGDEIKFQFTADDTDVSLTSHRTYGVHHDVAVVKIIRIA